MLRNIQFYGLTVVNQTLHEEKARNKFPGPSFDPPVAKVDQRVCLYYTKISWMCVSLRLVTWTPVVERDSYPSAIRLLFRTSQSACF